MLEIIKVQWFRLKKSVLFWVMLGLCVAFPLLGAVSTLMVSGIVDSVGGDGVNVIDMLSMMGMTGQYLNGMANLSNWAIVFALITASIVLSSEFVDGTMRNVLLANKSRGELFFSYLIMSVLVGVAYFLAYFATVLLVIAPIFGFDGMSAGPAVTASLCSFAQGIVGILFAQTCMCMFLFTMRKQWAAILFPLLVCIFLPYIILGFATLVLTTAAIKNQNISSLDGLRWVPLANATVYNSAQIDGITVGMNILYLAIFAAVFVVTGYFVFKKADLK